MSMKTSKSPDLGTSNDAQIYSLLSTSDEDHDSKTVAPASDSDGYFYQSKPKNYKFESKQVAIRHRLADVVIAIIATIVIVCVFRYLTFNSETLRDNAIASLYSNRARLTPLYHCGNSSSEARSLGCIFDLSLVGWVPGPCFDPILNQRFMDYGWRFFEDQNGTTEVSLDHIAKSAGTREPFWAQHGYHITHCELAWERMHRSLQGLGPRRLTTHLLNLEHTRHCGGMMEVRDGLDKLNSQILPLLNTC